MRYITLFLLGIPLLAGPALAVDITTPGQRVIRGDPGVVQVDFACGPLGGGVYLENGAKLYLNGHTLDGCGVFAASGSQTIPQRLSVFGPGTLQNGGIVLRSGKLRVRDVVITGGGILGSGDAADGPSTVNAVRVTITGSGYAGIQATRVSVRDVTITGGGSGGALGYGIIGWAGIKGRGVTLTDNAGDGAFVAWGSLTLKDATVTGNGGIGVIGDPHMKLVNAVVTGNNLAGDPLGADIASQVLPKLIGTTCGTSLNAQTLLPWGICTND